MKLESRHVEAVKRSSLISEKDSGLSRDGLYDAAYETLINEAPVLESYCATGAYEEEFPIVVRGFPGIYFVQALEFDDAGPFDTLDQARDAARSYGEAFEGFQKT